MAYNWNVPVYGSALQSDEIREALQAISTFHIDDNEPPYKQRGFQWLDTSATSNVKLKYYNGNSWITLIEHIETSPVFGTLADGDEEVSLDFYEGAVPPPAVNIDSYDFEDAAGFDPATDQDIIFRLEPKARYASGVKIKIGYCMSTAEAADVKLKLDYRIKEVGDDVSAGTDYSLEQVITPVGTADTIAVNEELVIPAAQISGTKEVVHCRLTRLASDVADTHSGILCIFAMTPRVVG